MNEAIQNIPPDFIKFLLVLVFSLLIGLEQRRHNISLDFEKLFGTDRTFTLIGIFGFVLYVISPKELTPFLFGGAALTLLLGIFYYQKIKLENKFGFTSLITALITYCLAPLAYTLPLWMVVLIVVCLLVITEIKESLFEFTKKFGHEEFITLAKFLAIAGVILPLLPDKPISDVINISPFKFWLTVVVISSISYFSYLLKKYVFPNAGIILTGILGGLYSSTATTVILAKKSKEEPGTKGFVTAIILATAMMYLRLFVLALIFNMDVALALLPYFAIFIVITVIIAFATWKLDQRKDKDLKTPITAEDQGNPLEFKTALIFAALFIFFAVATGYVYHHFGTAGISGMAYIVGVTDIDPFILNLFQHTGGIAASIVVLAVINAVTSNNVLKLVYALVFSEKSLRRELVISFSVLIAAGLAAGFLAPHLHL